MTAPNSGASAYYCCAESLKYHRPKDGYPPAPRSLRGPKCRSSLLACAVMLACSFHYTTSYVRDTVHHNTRPRMRNTLKISTSGPRLILGDTQSRSLGSKLVPSGELYLYLKTTARAWYRTIAYPRPIYYAYGCSGFVSQGKVQVLLRLGVSYSDCCVYICKEPSTPFLLFEH